LPSGHSKSPGGAGATIAPSFPIILALLLALLLGIAAMGISGCDAGQEAVDESRTFATQTAGDLTVTLRVNPYPPVPMRQAEFSISVSDAEGRPLVGAEVNCDMTMPAMPMPANRPRAVEQNPGVYTTPVLFTMAGDWEALIEVLAKDGVVERFSFAMTTR
jgi:hypothetical protein